MREALGAGPPTNAIPQLKITKHLAAKDSESIRGAISSYLEKKDELHKTQQLGTSTETEEDLRERLKKLEEQLALLQQKLNATSGAGLRIDQESNEHLAGIAGTAIDQSNAVGRGSDTTSPKMTMAVNTGKSRSDAVIEKHPQDRKVEDDTLARQIQVQSRSMESSGHQQLARSTLHAASTASDELSEQSLLDELFPEVSSQVQPVQLDRRPSPPKLDLPALNTSPIRLTRSNTRTDREKAIEAFRKSSEQTTVLQLSNCSTALTETDFRRLIPKGLHIESWSRDGEFYKIIPGRDPLSLERLPFYYLLFHTPTSALAYQKNAARLSKLCALHAPNSIHSAIPPPAGFLENGEDLHAVTSLFVLHPTGHTLDLRTVMQPYNRALRALIDAGGYAPIVSQPDPKGKKIYRVLMHIDGYEPSHWDLWQIISRHAHAHGIIWPFRNDHASAVRRLRDVINLKTVSKAKFQAISTSNPRAASSSLHTHKTDEVEYEDPGIAAFLSSTSVSGDNAKQANQLVMNRVYNRWIVEFEDEDAARRFAIMWHRVVLPDAKEKKGAWRDGEEVRWVGTEYLW